MSCEFCGTTWKPLFRIIERYESGGMIGPHCFECGKEEPNCKECEYIEETYQPYNQLNLTIAIVNGRLMFEDKVAGCKKQYAAINYCPMCGKELEMKS